MSPQNSARQATRAARRGKLDLVRNTFTPATAKAAVVGDPGADVIVLAMTSSAQLCLSQTAESATLGSVPTSLALLSSRRGKRSFAALRAQHPAVAGHL